MTLTENERVALIVAVAVVAILVICRLRCKKAHNDSTGSVGGDLMPPPPVGTPNRNGQDYHVIDTNVELQGGGVNSPSHNLGGVDYGVSVDRVPLLSGSMIGASPY